MPKLTPTAEQIQAIKQIAADGGHIPDVIAATGVSWPVARRWCKDLDIELAPTPPRVRDNQRLHGVGLDVGLNGEASRMHRARQAEAAGEVERISVRDRFRAKNG